MKRIISLFISFGLLFGLAVAQNQVNPMELPKLTQSVTDFSNTLTMSQLNELNLAAKTYENETSNQLFVVLFPHRQGNEMIDIGMKIFKDNKIGQVDKDNGLLLIISTEDKKIRIVVGYGLEGGYPDLVASQIIENDIRPLVNKGDFAGALQAFYDKSIQILNGEISEDYLNEDVSERDTMTEIDTIMIYFIKIIICSFVIAFLVAIVRSLQVIFWNIFLSKKGKRLFKKHKSFVLIFPFAIVCIVLISSYVILGFIGLIFSVSCLAIITTCIGLSKQGFKGFIKKMLSRPSSSFGTRGGNSNSSDRGSSDSGGGSDSGGSSDSGGGGGGDSGGGGAGD